MTDEELKHQLKRAYELRDFEITHYWKRAQYFWGFLAVIYAGFFAILISANKGDKIDFEYLLIICSIGCVFSYAWYLVNRGSKRWQEHWENVINDLESKLNIPLYSIKPKVQSSLFNAGNFSVSRINISVSLIIFISWILLGTFTAITYFENDIAFYVIILLAISSILFLYFMGRGHKGNEE
ncbi:MAG: RipA family octameric membrane protein [Allomuricauda sp.]